ncbi:hypothetical protein NQ317_009594 [Molorchus minor]|uniref:Uncharacterized protein n=1 Tax=Molorchus minor TaxID=1323400 RepID=A0ABQ9JRF3_9CUCU|nr:hypothetical protein NQ317_009594 [Molorchus minor]
MSSDVVLTMTSSSLTYKVSFPERDECDRNKDAIQIANSCWFADGCSVLRQIFGRRQMRPTIHYYLANRKVNTKPAIKKFMDWTLENGIKNISENVLTAYMKKLSCDIKPSALWTTYSMLKTMINIKNNIDISSYPKLCSFLKLKSTGYKTKKSKILTPEQIKHFLLKAPNREYLFTKKSGNNLTLTLIEKQFRKQKFQSVSGQTGRRKNILYNSSGLSISHSND